MKSENDWEPKDLWLALLFLGVGGLLLVLSYSLRANDWSTLFWALPLVPGLVLLALGVTGIVRSLK